MKCLFEFTDPEMWSPSWRGRYGHRCGRAGGRIRMLGNNIPSIQKVKSEQQVRLDYKSSNLPPIT